MRIVCHLGFPRTASTFLQSNIFPLHKQINLLGPKNYVNWEDVKITQDDLNLISEKNYDDNLKNKVINEIEKNLIKYFDEKKVNIITSERYTTYKNIINDFRDLKYLEILLNQNFKDVKIDFLIILRDQYELIKSYYYHDYQNTSDFLRINKFKSIFDFSDKNYEDKVPLNLFLNQFDFNHLYNKLFNKFENSNIKFLFYEDLRLDKDHFSNELSDFCDFDKNYTKELFNSMVVNYRTIKGNKNYYVKGYIYKIIRSRIYLYIKSKLPFKKILKKFIWDYFILSNENINTEEEIVFKKKIKEYYKTSNLQFFKQIKLINKYNY